MQHRVAPALGHAGDAVERLRQQRLGARLAAPRVNQRLDRERERHLAEPLASAARRVLQRLLPAAPVEQAARDRDHDPVAGNRRLVVVEQPQRVGGDVVDDRVLARVGGDRDAVDVGADRLHVQAGGACVRQRPRQHARSPRDGPDARTRARA